MTGVFRVLVIEGDAEEGAQLQRVLAQCETGSRGLHSIQVNLLKDIASALELYASLRPGLVIFGPVASQSVRPPNLQALRLKAGLEPVPILCVKSELESLTPATLRSGCDDILLQPYNPRLVQLKLAALQRFCAFNRTLLTQRNRIRRNHAGLLQEQETARQIFNRMGEEGCLNQSDAIRYHLSPRAILNGDVLAAANAPGDKLVVLLGDFTGHGLAAAVGAVPLTAIFYSMVPKGFSISHILRELNAQMHRVLPANLFCCAVMLELDPHKRHIRLFNGGMPSPCIYHRSGQMRLLKSRHLPLGVLGEAEIEEAIEHIPLEEGDYLYLWSDGLHEASNRRGDFFGEERLLQALSEPSVPEQRFQQVLNAVRSFSVGPGDDLSFVELALDRVGLGRERRPPAATVGDAGSRGVGDWSLQFTFGPQELRDADPLPLLHSVLAQVPGTGRFHDSLTIVLGELFRNALEHGLLNLDSGLKSTEAGFADYYRGLHEGRQGLNDGWISIELRCRTRGGAGVLEVTVEDSGLGFPMEVREGGRYAGRGLPLLRAICRRLEVQAGSSRVRAVLNWGPAREAECPSKSVLLD